MWKLQPPPWKKSPVFPSNPSLKFEVLLRPPFWKFGCRFNPLPPAEKGCGGRGWWGAHCVSRAKGHKMVQNDKTLYPLCSISQDPYIIWLSFMIHMCKMIISPCVFSIFFNIFIFRVVSGVKGQKMTKNWQKWQKNYVRRAPYLRMVVIYGTHV